MRSEFESRVIMTPLLRGNASGKRDYSRWNLFSDLIVASEAAGNVHVSALQWRANVSAPDLATSGARRLSPHGRGRGTRDAVDHVHGGHAPLQPGRTPVDVRRGAVTKPLAV